MSVAYVLRSWEIAERNDALMLQRSAGLGHFVIPELEAAAALGATPPGTPVIERLRLIPHLRNAVLCDEAGHILHGTRPGLAGSSLAEFAPTATKLLADHREPRTARFEFSADRAVLWSAFPLRLGETGRGWLCTESDVAAPTAPAVAAQFRGTALIAGLILLICAGLWYY